MSEHTPSPETGLAPKRRVPLWQKLIPWLITAACFAYLYTRIGAAAGREGESVAGYLGGVFAGVDWGLWLTLMIPYSAFFFIIDSAVVWRVINWYNTRIAYRDILPIRGSSYIISILNEQVGKGAMGLYLYRRYDVPGWEVGSSMLFIMFCEFFYLLFWATIGYGIASEHLPPQFAAIPYIAAFAALFFIAFFRRAAFSLAALVFFRLAVFLWLLLHCMRHVLNINSSFLT